MSQVKIDGVTYVPLCECGDIKIVVLERGFIYVGYYRESDGQVEIQSARCLVNWGTSKHLGELVNGPLEKTKLGDGCLVKSRLNQVLHTIEVSQDAWSKHIN